MMTISIRDTAVRQLDLLFEGVREVDFVDFPDYANVGDSAIALGLLGYFRTRKVTVRSIRSIQTLGAAHELRAETVVFNGGGNLGGLYPIADEHRRRLIEGLPGDVRLIQAPQTIDVISEQGRATVAALVARRNTRIGVRDSESAAVIASLGGASILSPDSAHLLSLSRQAETDGTVTLLRTDGESSGLSAGGGSSEDWLRDDFGLAVSSKIRRQARRLNGASALINPSPRRWEAIANARLERGVKQLARGRTVLTDRLHARILARSLGRPVIALDNTTRKLSRYASQWGFSEGVTFVKDLDSARRELNAHE